MTEFEKIVIEKLGNMETKIDSMETKIDSMETKIDNMETRMDRMENDISALKKTAIKVETELVPKTQLMLDSYMSIVDKVKISDDIQEEVKILRYEVDVLKQAAAQK